MVRFLGPDTDAFVDSVVRHADEFRRSTGLTLDLKLIPSDEYFSNAIHPYLEGDGAADVFYLKIADRWVRGLRSAFGGDQSLRTALEHAALDMDRIAETRI